MADYITGDIFILRPPQQTLKAWGPFWDCVNILFFFQNSDVADGEQERTEWRLYWVSGIVLLRAIGHVLAKVDANSSEKHSSEISKFWDRIKIDHDDSWIFWEFIEKERNNIVKTYSFGAKFRNKDGEPVVEFEEGEDAFQLFRCAVYWWRYQLMELESLIS